MYIAQIYSIILFSFGAAAVYLGASALRKKFRDYIGNLVLGCMCISSAIWCYGFGMVFLTSDTRIAYWGRTLGMIGVFGYLLFVQILVGVVGIIPKKLYSFFCIFASLGIVLYVPLVNPKLTTYYMDEKGMTYTFAPGMVNNLYTVFSLIYAINMVVSIYSVIKRAIDTRSKVAGRKMMITLIIVFFGMILDTILPMFGFGAIPGSSISQFIGLLVIYYAIVDFNTTRITAMNMSQYVYSSVSEPIMVFTKEGVLKLTNKAADAAFAKRYELNDNSEMKIQEIFDLEENHLDYEGDHRTDDSHTIVDNIPVQIQTSRIADRYGDTIGFILTIKDMTRINMMMDSLVEAKQLAEANNLAKSTFLANMSHEIRTPLNAIVGFSELLLKSEIDSKDREYVDDIRNSSYNLLAIINDILDISKIESGKMELSETEYSVAEVIKDAYHITDTLAAKKGLEFSMDIDEFIPSKLYGDPVRIRGVLVNVLNNAVKYTMKGFVKFEGRFKGMEKKPDGDYALIQFSVTDTGIGIKEEDKSILFESFQQVDKKVNSGIEGTGLGLAIVKGFVELMGGNIELESVYGKGSKFTINLKQKIIDKAPIRKIQVTNDKEETKSAISDIKYTGVRVLAVDDNKVNLKIVSLCLKKYEMVVTLADSGEESIKLCTDNDYDIILMDQMMPGMDGIEAMQKIREISPRYAKGGECAIIALTANAISGVKEKLVSIGFDDYLSKPIDFARMEEMFNEILK